MILQKNVYNLMGKSIDYFYGNKIPLNKNSRFLLLPKRLLKFLTRESMLKCLNPRKKG